jgi:hypothetical protein
MTPQELQLKYDRLVTNVYKLRNRQKEYFKYRASSDLEACKRLSKVVDDLVEEEIKYRKSKQIPLI